MNQRDELAKVIITAYGEDAEKECPCEQDLDVADAILAAGYVKPYLVTTSTELESLPNHSVIVDKDADIWQKRGDEWCSYETNPHIDVRLLKYAPLTVIHEGGTA